MRIPIETTWAVLLRRLFGQSGHSIPASMEQVVWQVRTSRIILGFLARGGPALCDCVMQTVVQNPMADPYILSVSAGTILGTAGSPFLGVGVVSGFWAFLGTGLACLLVLILTSVDGKTTSVRLVLAGMIVNALLTASSDFIVAVAGNSDGVLSIELWTMGVPTRAGWKNIGLITVIVALAALYFMSQTRALDDFLLSEEAAVMVGINTFRCRLAYLLVLSLLTGALILARDTIGFAGLIIPHLARALVGIVYRGLLPVAALSGGLLMLWVDALARSLLPNTELPVSVFTALIGAPFFVYMMVRKRCGFGGR